MKLVIIGGGFAGLKLARSLNNKEGVEVLLIDRFNYHQFQPLFYQVATGGLDASNISFPLRKIFQHSRNVRFRLATVQQVKTDTQEIVTDIGNFSYDTLVLAMGAGTNFFGNTNLQAHAFPMKSTTEALQLRHHLIQNLEDALSITDTDELHRKLNIVVVGGGPTGVEVSGALAEMRNNILPKDYPELDFSRMHIFLLEGSPNTLSAMSEKSRQQSRKYLTRLGVDVRTNTVVQDFDGKQVTLNDGSTILATTVIWAAGIKGNIPAGIDPALIVRGNRVKVDRYNKIEGFGNVYALGDIAYMETPLFPHGHPQVANVAVNQGKNLAKNLLRKLKGNNTLTAFEYKDKGSLATVGRNLAVVDIPKPKIHFGGFLAWLFWMVLHLVLIVGVKNRLQIFVNWIYKYFTYDQSLRLLFREFYRHPAPDKNV
jgi:NADH dehydrogenase